MKIGKNNRYVELRAITISDTAELYKPGDLLTMLTGQQATRGRYNLLKCRRIWLVKFGVSIPYVLRLTLRFLEAC